MGVSGPSAHGQLSSLSPKDTAGEGRLAFSLRHHWWSLRPGAGAGQCLAPKRVLVSWTQAAGQTNPKEDQRCSWAG